MTEIKIRKHGGECEYKKVTTSGVKAEACTNTEVVQTRVLCVKGNVEEL